MTSTINELCENYQKLSNNLAKVDDKDGILRTKLALIDHKIIDINIAVEDLNVAVLQHKLELTDKDRQDLDNMIIANKTIKAFAPYIMWFNIYQKLNKEKET